MADFLTDRNGVVCRGCFRTIDLTKLTQPDTVPKWVKIVRKMSDEPSYFNVTCPYCKQKKSYSYEKDVKPISDLSQIIDANTLKSDGQDQAQKTGKNGQFEPVR